jgi:hypothetical protein
MKTDLYRFACHVRKVIEPSEKPDTQGSVFRNGIY